MANYWSNELLGRYDPQDGWLGIDYRRHFLNPHQTMMTYIHEQAHGILCNGTEYGQATKTLLRFLPHATAMSEEQRAAIFKKLHDSQFYVQEAAATLAPIFGLRDAKGPAVARKWAKDNLPDDYYNRVEGLFFALEFGARYRELFLQQSSHLAMHTRIRKDVVALDLLRNPERFIDYLSQPDNVPSERFKKLTQAFWAKPYLPTRSDGEVAQYSNLPPFENLSKDEVANFLNYVAEFCGLPVRTDATRIGDPLTPEAHVKELAEHVLIANMNFNLPDRAMWLKQTDDLKFISDKVDAVIINRVEPSSDLAENFKIVMGREADLGIVTFQKTGEVYLTGLSEREASEILQRELQDATLITKWGLYEPGSENVSYFPSIRRPDVVIYNTLGDMRVSMQKYLEQYDCVCFNAQASPGSPIHTFVIVDQKGTLHMLNAMGVQTINSFLSDNKEHLHVVQPDQSTVNPVHYNNVLSVWNDLPWNVDWYASMLDGENVVNRS